jgi:hypothetical protein
MPAVALALDASLARMVTGGAGGVETKSVLDAEGNLLAEKCHCKRFTFDFVLFPTSQRAIRGPVGGGAHTRA